MSAPLQSFDFGAALVNLAAQGVNGNTADQLNPAHRGIKLWINISAISGAGATLVVTLKGKDPATGNYVQIIASASLTATGEVVLTVYPGLTPAANVAASDVLPPTWRVEWTITGTTPSITFTIGASKLA